jgi:hypothetical protein
MEETWQFRDEMYWNEKMSGYKYRVIYRSETYEDVTYGDVSY